MKNRGWRIEGGGWQTRSVLECGSPLPLSGGNERARIVQSAGGPAHSKTWRLIVAALAFVMMVALANAQTYSVDWHKIAGGGGTSTNGQYSLTGTIGQPDASGAMSSGQYSISGGYWSLINVVQTAGAPTLNISYNGSTVTVYWQNVSGWNLIQSGDLTTPIGSWSASSSPTLTGGTNYLNVANPSGNVFYRLKQ